MVQVVLIFGLPHQIAVGSTTAIDGAGGDYKKDLDAAPLSCTG